MSTIGENALPALNPSFIPAEVREGSAEDKKAYRAALGFERSLLQQLTKTMLDTAKTEDTSSDEESGETAATQMYKDMLPDRLADSLIANGGIGLAEDLYRAVRQAGK